MNRPDVKCADGSAAGCLLALALCTGALPLGTAACSDAGSRGDAEPGDAAIADGARSHGRDSGLDGSAGCPHFSRAREVGRVAQAAITEASGLAASRHSRGVLWTHNDSGGRPRLYALSVAGAHLGSYALGGAKAVDYEDIAIGPGPRKDSDYLYVGDIGDNAAARGEIVVYRVAEPRVTLGQKPADTTLGGVAALRFRYPGGARDAEALIVDPREGDLYIITKRSDGASGIYRSRAPQDSGQLRTLTRMATLQLARWPAVRVKSVTGADISPDGSQLLLRTYADVLWWSRDKGQAVEAALDAKPCSLPIPLEIQGEAIAFSADGKSYYTLSEGTRRPIYAFTRR